MSTLDRATSAELAAEFERAMGSLATEPLVCRSPVSLVARAYVEAEEANLSIKYGASHAELAKQMTRIAAIALEGAARLRRQQ
jgi:hypothetical protein